MLNYTTDLKLSQNLDYYTGIPQAKLAEFKFKSFEFLREKEIKKFKDLVSNPEIGQYVSSLLYEQECEIPEISELIDLLNSKRAVMFIDEFGETKFVCIPSNRDIQEGVLNHYNAKLLKFALAYINWKDCDPINRDSAFETFEYARLTLQKEVAKRIYSKDFKLKNQLEFNGISGVALTGNCGVNEIQVPKWYADEIGFGIGELGIVTRDPIQNLFITLKVSGFTENEIRVNGHTYTILDGDFDGDRIQFIPWKNITKQFKKLNVGIDKQNNVYKELLALLPTVLIEREDCKHLTADYDKELLLSIDK